MVVHYTYMLFAALIYAPLPCGLGPLDVFADTTIEQAEKAAIEERKLLLIVTPLSLSQQSAISFWGAEELWKWVDANAVAVLDPFEREFPLDVSDPGFLITVKDHGNCAEYKAFVKEDAGAVISWLEMVKRGEGDPVLFDDHNEGRGDARTNRPAWDYHIDQAFRTALDKGEYKLALRIARDELQRVQNVNMQILWIDMTVSALVVEYPQSRATYEQDLERLAALVGENLSREQSWLLLIRMSLALRDLRFVRSSLEALPSVLELGTESDVHLRIGWRVRKELYRFAAELGVLGQVGPWSRLLPDISSYAEVVAQDIASLPGSRDSLGLQDMCRHASLVYWEVREAGLHEIAELVACTVLERRYPREEDADDASLFFTGNREGKSSR